MGEFSTALQSLFVKRAVQGQVRLMAFDTIAEGLMFLPFQGGPPDRPRSSFVQFLRPLETMDHSTRCVDTSSTPFSSVGAHAGTGIILMMAQLLGLLLGKIKQPRVIAEIIGGILLGRLGSFVCLAF